MNLEFADLISIAVYVIMGLAMYRMASTNGLSRPWLAWIPLGTDYVMGSVAEKSDACLGRQGKSYRRILLGLAIAAVAGGIVLVVLGIIVLIALFADTGLDFRVL